MTATIVAGMGWIAWNFFRLDRARSRAPERSDKSIRMELGFLFLWFGMFACLFAAAAITGHCWGTDVKPGAG